jgi:superfamily I DNA/RNA helicase
MAIRYLINEDGSAFSKEELGALRDALDSLSVDDRKSFRDKNAAAVATHPADQILIVAGPGTGKSTLFKQRILYWLKQSPQSRILAMSFVRKLVADLSSDIQNDKALGVEQKQQVDVHTLHKYARSIVEQNRGTREWKFQPHFRIIGQSWKDVVWYDVLLLSGQKDHERYAWDVFEKQLHIDVFDDAATWKTLKATYFTLCQFYNAAGFSDLILRAKDALVENPSLNTHQHFIIDEYQDFNASEENLLKQVTVATAGKLVVGDDDQVLYETLKSGQASLIRAIYGDKSVVNAMLPFCGRCGFHITRASEHFIKQAPDADSIEKIYLPMSDPGASERIQIVGCATPTTAVDYIRKFIEVHAAEIEQRRQDLADGNAKDAYLLILSPSRAVNFYRPSAANEQLFELIKSYTAELAGFSEDYYRVLNYYSLAIYASNNFTLRKVLHYEQIDDEELVALLQSCIEQKKRLAEVDTPSVRSALQKAKIVYDIVESKLDSAGKVEALAKHVQLVEPALLKRDLENAAINKDNVEAIEHQEEEDAELEELEVKQMSAVELMTIVGAKGLSADHVIIIGFDDVNMRWVTRNAFYVAMTRARKSLHLVTALRAGGAKRPHPFLDHLPATNLEYARYTKGNRTKQQFPNRAEFERYLRDLGRAR